MTIDLFIILTAKLLGWAILAALTVIALWMAFAFAYRLYRNAIGWPIMAAAVREYRKTHPEAFKHFDKTSRFDQL